MTAIRVTVRAGINRFGHLLDWTRSEEGYATGHGGRGHEITRLSLAAADQVRGRAGWRFAYHPDEIRDLDAPLALPGGGPELGRRLDVAFRCAEMWILVDKLDRRPGEHGPNLLLAVRQGGAVFGRDLVARADHERGAIAVHRDGPGEKVGRLIGRITPKFADDLSITWHVTDLGGREWAASDRFHDACRLIGDALT